MFSGHAVSAEGGRVTRTDRFPDVIRRTLADSRAHDRAPGIDDRGLE